MTAVKSFEEVIMTVGKDITAKASPTRCSKMQEGLLDVTPTIFTVNLNNHVVVVDISGKRRERSSLRLDR